MENSRSVRAVAKLPTICRQLAAFFSSNLLLPNSIFRKALHVTDLIALEPPSRALMDVLLMSHRQQPGEKRESYLSLSKTNRTRQMALRMNGIFASSGELE